MAKLIAELNGKGQSGKAAIDFLRETLDAYDNFKRLKRARTLQGKPDLTSAEKELLKAYRDDENLAPYLNSPSPNE